MNFQKLKNHLDRFLPLYVSLSMLLGFFAGLHMNVKAHGNLFKTLNMLVVISMIYPMMINLRIEVLKKTARSWKNLLIALIIGLVYAPLLMYALAFVFHINPTLSLGLLLAVVVPCSSMAIAYTGLSEGNLELATIIVAVSFTLAIATVPGWLKLFASTYHLNISAWLLIKTILIVVFVPLIFGYLTRIYLLKKIGTKGFEKIKPLFPSISLLGMYAIVLLIFMEKAKLMASKAHVVAVALIPLVLYYVITLLLLTYFNKKIGLKYEDHMAIVFTSVGKNEGTAMAIAISAGMGLMAIPPAIVPILQIPFLVSYVKFGRSIKRLYAREKAVTLEAQYLGALACETKMGILDILGRGERCTCKLAEELGVDQSIISRHLKTLEESGIVNSRREGASVYYRIIDKEFLKLITPIAELLKRKVRRS